MARIGIALCITDLRLGGAERCLVHLATGLDRERFAAEVYVLEPPPPQEQAAGLEALRAAGIEAHFLHARRVWQVGRVASELTQLLADQSPQILQSFLFHANLVSRIAARRAGLPHVLSGIRVAEPGRRWRLWLDRATDGLVERHVCVSQSVAEFARTKGRLPVGKLAVIPNAVDFGRFPAEGVADLRSLGIAKHRRVVSFVGRLERQKGLRWLINSSAGWLSRLPDTDLLLVGDGPLRVPLERLCHRRGIADRVVFAGWRPDVPEILAASDLLVLPSAWEGMPNVVLEAMATGLPVVATDVEGVRELLGPGADKQTVRFGDSSGFSEKVVALMDDPRAAMVGVENSRRCEAFFSVGKMVDAYQDLWQSLLSEKP